MTTITTIYFLLIILAVLAIASVLYLYQQNHGVDDLIDDAHYQEYQEWYQSEPHASFFQRLRIRLRNHN